MKSNIILLFVLLFFLSSCDDLKPKNSAEMDKSSASEAWVNPGIMTPEVLWKLGRVSEVQVAPDGKSLIFGITHYDLSANKGNKDIYWMDIESGDIKQLTNTPKSEFNLQWHPDGNRIAFLSSASGSSQIYELDLKTKNTQQISKLESGVNGFKFSPDGKKVMLVCDVKIDKTPQEIYPDLPLTNVKIYDELMYRHWDHWADELYSHVFIADYQKGKLGKTVDLMAGERFNAPREPFQGIEDINFSPDGTQLAVSYKRLSGKDYAVSTNSEIYIYDLVKGGSKNLTENGFDGYDYGPVWSPDGKNLVFSSMATPGFEADKERIMVYNFDTDSFVDWSKDFDQSSHSFTFNKTGDKLYFISGIEATYQMYELSFSDGKIRAVTHGDHDYQNVEVAGDLLIGTKTNMKTPSEIYAVTLDGTEKQLSFTNKEILDSITPAEYKKRWVATTDGKKELVWVIYPPDFDSTKQYPTLLYCQGGPQSAVSQTFSYRWNFQVMASNGYIVVAPNRRGLPTFGQEWNDQISGDYGGQNMQDYLSAIDEVAKESYVDRERLGAVGASYGGYSVYWLAGNHNGRFKAFISHCGIFDLPSMYAETEETFFNHHDNGGAPWDKPQPKTYSDFNPRDFVGKWDTPILVITGGNDFRIPYTQSMQAFNAAQLKGIPSRFLFFPEESHFVLQPQNSVLWQREFKAFLDKYLK
jgi:dipeptidyl aminopeptidase/acylaminoacyl peptidase